MKDLTVQMLDEIEAQLDETTPYYLPRLIAAFRQMHADLISAQARAKDQPNA
jgi:hypothetical protein